jgi:NADPH-dependent 2,4-dienoyl-CoA reductase/sulfur reductase-like enzyme/nitrite reductase/ring-hydroxylating ferredoxin subunit
MGSDAKKVTGPDLAVGIHLSELSDGSLLEGHVGEDPVLLARRGEEIFALSAKCTHYGASLAEGIATGETVRCPWHHACFSLRTGEAVGAPAFDPLDRWKVARRGDHIFVEGKLEREAAMRMPQRRGQPGRIVIIGGGAAGFAAAEMLRRRGHGGELTMISPDDAPPYDRPNVSKDYLAGQAPEEWMPLRGPEFYADNGIDLQLRTTIDRIDTEKRRVLAQDGRTFAFDRLLLATGAEPVPLSVPGADTARVFTLRSLTDSRALIKAAESAKSVVVVGAGFIGLEVAGALRARDIEVHVVAPDVRPMEKILGAELGDFIRSLQERHGVKFHLQQKIARIEDGNVVLEGGDTLDLDLIVAGIGVKPCTGLAEKAGLKVDGGVLVDEYLETSVPGIFAAGDVARWPDARTGERIRVEHWVVAQRQGQTAALNMLGLREPFVSVPFFWSRHYDVSIHYIGHAQGWYSVEVEGDVASGDCLIRYVREKQVLAVASIGRDVQTLQIEAEFERELQSAESRKPMLAQA